MGVVGSFALSGILHTLRGLHHNYSLSVVTVDGQDPFNAGDRTLELAQTIFRGIDT